MDTTERSVVLAFGNSPERALPAESPIARIAEHSRATPHAIAVRFRDDALTYAALECQSNQLAHYVVSLGAGAGQRVVVCLEPGLAAVVAMFAVWKAGAVYVPLDPGYPPARIAAILDDTRPALIVTSSLLAERIRERAEPRIAVDRDAQLIEGLPVTPPAVPLAPDQPAYMFYTSGTTGTPKGIVASHRNLAQYVSSAIDRYGITAADVIPAIARFSFSISLFELVTPLAAGGTLIVLEREHVLDLARMARTLQQVTLFHAGPSLLRNLLAYIVRTYPDLEPFARVRHASSGGDLVPPEVLAGLLRVFSGAEVYVIYGCSEISCMGCTWEVSRDHEVERTYVGRPFGNVTVRVLDERGEPVPVGVVGDVHFAGPGVVLGYPGRPELEREKFVVRDGARFYATGDVGRWSAAGELELLGRKDFQVQIRGMRVEPGEIEHALRKAPGVRDGVVVARPLGDGEDGLVAYYVPQLGAADAAANTAADARARRRAIRRHLADTLPDYMVPARYVELGALPLNVNMKVDRRALPAPVEAAQADADRPLRAPAGATELGLATIWQELLGARRLGADDDFFELGGNSLLVMQAISRIRAVFNVELPLRALFEAPVLADLARAIDAQKGAGASAAIPRLSDAERSGRLPLSSAQQRMWFWSELAPDTALYNVPVALALSGKLDAAALRGALRDLLERHEILRSRWELHDGEAFQRIEALHDWPLREVTLDAVAGERAAELDALQPFDLTRMPAVRGLLVTVAPDQHRLVLTLHHSVCDGWATGILVDDLCTLYAARVAGRPAELPELALQYADFAVWEQEATSRARRATELGYWREQLRGAPPTLDLATDHRRPSEQQFHGALVPIAFSGEEVDALRGLAKRTGTTLFMVLLALWQTVLHRHSGQATIVTGSVIANRDRRELEGVIGYFANTLALRAEFTPGLTVQALLAQVRTTALDAYDHQHVPFEEVVEALALPRDRSRIPLIQTFLELQPPAPADLAVGALRLTRTTLTAPVAKFDLSLTLQERAAELAGGLEYDTALFTAATIARLAGHLHVLAAAMCADETRPVATLPLLTEPERRQLLVRWNDTSRSFDLGQPIHARIAARAAQQPAAPAVVLDDRTLTYAELAAQVTRWARRLRAAGVGPDVRVGVCMERAPELVVAILAVLEAGGAYVPLDPEAPADRLAFLIADTAAPIVLTQAHVRERLGGLPAAVRVYSVDQDVSEADPALPAPSARATRPDDAAYVIHTSGSTGRPKGVVISHGSLVNHVLWLEEVLGLTPADRWLQKTAITFDASISELFTPLHAGAALVLARPGAHRDPQYLVRALRAQHITILQMVPSALRVLVSEPEFDACGDLRHLMSGGEPLDAATIAEVRARLPAVVVGNYYGPTEATVDATWWIAPPGAGDPDAGTAPIGRPAANHRAYLLDASMQPVPIGAVGELYLGGAGLARGYLNRPDLTAERFVPDPFVPGERLYRTGDRARYRDDGNLEYRGRGDDQIKLHGHRVELGEIESVLAAQPGVRHGAVVVREDRPGQLRLAAYVDGHVPDVAPLRAALAAQLPAYMLPASITVLPRFPTLASGKIDRHALPAPDEPAARPAPVAPRTPSEALVLAAFREGLGRDDAGLAESFFDLGGHSLLAGRVMARLRARAGVDLPLRALFEHPTAEGLAAALDALAWAASAPVPVPQNAGREEFDV